jgi:hypothetical protein
MHKYKRNTPDDDLCSVCFFVADDPIFRTWLRAQDLASNPKIQVIVSKILNKPTRTPGDYRDISLNSFSHLFRSPRNCNCLLLYDRAFQFLSVVAVHTKLWIAQIL